MRRLSVLMRPSDLLSRLMMLPLMRFATVGLLTTALDFGLFSALARGLGVPPVPSNLVSYSCGIVTSFVLNRHWTFSTRGRGGIERHALRFLLSNLAGLALSTLLVGLLAHMLPPLVAKLISVPIVFVWNYLASRFWVFTTATP
jgi:putative flippase GtrA